MWILIYLVVFVLWILSHASHHFTQPIDAHMRLTLTRGEKCTSSMNPKFNVYGTTLIILPEWKPTEVSSQDAKKAKNMNRVPFNSTCL